MYIFMHLISCHAVVERLSKPVMGNWTYPQDISRWTTPSTFPPLISHEVLRQSTIFCYNCNQSNFYFIMKFNFCICSLCEAFLSLFLRINMHHYHFQFIVYFGVFCMIVAQNLDKVVAGDHLRVTVVNQTRGRSLLAVHTC